MFGVDAFFSAIVTILPSITTTPNMELVQGTPSHKKTMIFYVFLLENFEPIQYRHEGVPPKAPEISPYNGFGSEEDSLSNCLHLIPKPPRRDFQKFMAKDR